MTVRTSLRQSLRCRPHAHSVLTSETGWLHGKAIAETTSVRAFELRQSFFGRRVILPLLELLRQGITPEKLAAAIAMGAILGVFPVLGSTTILCAVAAAVLRLNLPLIQIVNTVVYPLQLILLVPMLQLGQKLFGAPPLPLTLPRIFDMIRASVWNTISSLGVATARAIVVWLCLSWAVALAIYFLSLLPLRMLKKARP
jgi:uncharacterized protein (DUF2062 family)